jgi:hypothetical protein
MSSNEEIEHFYSVLMRHFAGFPSFVRWTPLLS